MGLACQHLPYSAIIGQRHINTYMKRLRVGCDIDGCLAKFNDACADLFTEQTGVRFPKESDIWPNTWHWERVAGVTKEDEKAVWDVIKRSDDFWFNLPPYPGACAFLTWLKYFEQDVYFVTNRSGHRAKYQTERWLHKTGYAEPTVLISQEKDLVCKALKLTHYIDDKLENCAAVASFAPETKGYMFKRPWNEPIQMVPRLSCLKDFQNVLMLACLEN